MKSHRFYYGSIVDPATMDCVDEVMAVQMLAPRSYTREDVLEIHCHGGFLVVQRILELVLQAGARLAEPGEFTKRAFLNGRIDLVQAEAVIDVIRSKTEASLALAQHQREGILSGRIFGIRDHLASNLALVEAHIDFPEDDITGEAASEIRRLAESALNESADLLAGFSEGRVLREGVSVLIIGKPNAGKSSLLNVLLQERRAIVTAQPGTTRDIIEEVVNISGLPVRILDTAGIREAEDLVEREGIRLALENIPSADLVLFVLDVTRPFDDDDRMILRELHQSKVLVVRNKTDQSSVILTPEFPAGWGIADISAASGAGVNVLRAMIREAFLHGQAVDSRDYVSLSHHRHRDALLRCRSALGRFVAGLTDGSGAELLAIDLRDALHAIGEITGETTPDDILDLIFSRFCIGK